MRHESLCIGLAAPLALLLGLAPALAQQTVPPPSPEGSRESASDETRELESEIEAYPGPRDGVREESGADSVDTRIPEQINPAPRKPSVTPRSTQAAPASAAGAATGDRSSSPIDPSEVQRVFGSDVELIALSSLAPGQVTRLQLRLRDLGHYLGRIDGIAGAQTRAALQGYTRSQFALKQRLLQQNQLTTDLAEQLGVHEGTSSAGEPSFRDDADRPTSPSNTGPRERGDAPLLPPGAAPMPPSGVTPLPPSGGPPLPTPSSAPSPSRGPTPAAPPQAPPSP
jgi:hypothetical protein